MYRKGSHSMRISLSRHRDRSQLSTMAEDGTLRFTNIEMEIDLNRKASWKEKGPLFTAIQGPFGPFGSWVFSYRLDTFGAAPCHCKEGRVPRSEGIEGTHSSSISIFGKRFFQVPQNRLLIQKMTACWTNPTPSDC